MADLRVLDHPGFDGGEFLARWREARLAALRRRVPRAAQHGEAAALQALPEEAHDEVLRDAFLNSFRFAQSAVRRFGLAWDEDDLAEVLALADGPCLRGDWSPGPGPRRLERDGCAGTSCSTLVCDYWRESIDGLVCGLADEVRYTRQRSAARGGGRCVDVLYRESEPAERFESLPDEHLAALAEIAARFRRLGMELRFLGLAEGQLHYTLTQRGSSLCGGALDLFAGLLRNNLEHLCPGLGLREATGRAVAI